MLLWNVNPSGRALGLSEFPERVWGRETLIGPLKNPWNSLRDLRPLCPRPQDAAQYGISARLRWELPEHRRGPQDRTAGTDAQARSGPDAPPLAPPALSPAEARQAWGPPGARTPRLQRSAWKAGPGCRAPAGPKVSRPRALTTWAGHSTPASSCGPSLGAHSAPPTQPLVPPQTLLASRAPRRHSTQGQPRWGLRPAGLH